MIDMLACVETDGFQLEVLRRVSLALLALALAVYVLMKLWGARRFGHASPTVIEGCHKGYAWSDIDKVYRAAGPDKLAAYRSRQLRFDRLFALIYGVAATVTGVWVYADGCRGLGERWFALSLIAIGLFAMIFDWLEGSALRRVTRAWEKAHNSGAEIHPELALSASRRTVTKFWLFLVALLQVIWFHITAVSPTSDLAIALACGLIAGVFLGKPNPDLREVEIPDAPPAPPKDVAPTV
jgi:hypothetical protein